MYRSVTTTTTTATMTIIFIKQTIVTAAAVPQPPLTPVPNLTPTIPTSTIHKYYYYRIYHH